MVKAAPTERDTYPSLVLPLILVFVSFCFFFAVPVFALDPDQIGNESEQPRQQQQENPEENSLELPTTAHNFEATPTARIPDFNDFIEGPSAELRPSDARIRFKQPVEEVLALKDLFVARENFRFFHSYRGNLDEFLKDVDAERIRMIEGSTSLGDIPATDQLVLNLLGALLLQHYENNMSEFRADVLRDGNKVAFPEHLFNTEDRIPGFGELLNERLLPIFQQKFSENLESFFKDIEKRSHRLANEHIPLNEVTSWTEMMAAQLRFLWKYQYHNNDKVLLSAVEQKLIRLTGGKNSLPIKTTTPDDAFIGSETNGMADPKNWRFELMSDEDTQQVFVKFAPRENHVARRARRNRFRIFFVGEEFAMNKNGAFDTSSRDFRKKSQRVLFDSRRHLLVIDEAGKGFFLRRPKLFENWKLNPTYLRGWKLATVERTTPTKIALGSFSAVANGSIMFWTAYHFGGSSVKIAAVTATIRGVYAFFCTTFKTTYERIVGRPKDFFAMTARRTLLDLPGLFAISWVQRGPGVFIDPQTHLNNDVVSSIGKGVSTIWNFIPRAKQKYGIYDTPTYRILGWDTGIKRSVIGMEIRAYIRTFFDMAAIQWDSNPANPYRFLGKTLQIASTVPVLLGNWRFVRKYEKQNPDLRKDYNKMMMREPDPEKREENREKRKKFFRNIGATLTHWSRLKNRCWQTLAAAAQR